MEESTVRVILHALVDLMCPDDASRPFKIYELEVWNTSTIQDECQSALKTCIRPFLWFRISIVDASKCGIEDLVEVLWYRFLDLGFVVV